MLACDNAYEFTLVIVSVALVIVRTQSDHIIDISGKFISFVKTTIFTWDQNA